MAVRYDGGYVKCRPLREHCLFDLLVLRTSLSVSRITILHAKWWFRNSVENFWYLSLRIQSPSKQPNPKAGKSFRCFAGSTIVLVVGTQKVKLLKANG